MNVSVDKLTEVYLKIKARREELSKEFRDEDERLKAQQETIKTHLLQHCQEQDTESVRTKSGTFFRQIKTRYWTNDWPSTQAFIVENNVPELFTKSLNQSNCKQYLEDNPDMVIPGLNVDSEYVISVRKSKS